MAHLPIAVAGSTAAPRIAVIGFGRLGRGLAERAAARALDIAVFDTAFARPESAPARAAVAMPVLQFASARGAVAEAAIVIAAVPGEMALEVARAVSDGIERDTWFLDMSGVAGPARLRVRDTVVRAGARYLTGTVRVVSRGAQVMRTLVLNGAGAAILARLLRIAGINAVSVEEDAIPVGGGAPILPIRRATPAQGTVAPRPREAMA
jgi:3-hydroxyisobutyrate dehydrogenase-like beta-hydroxyacid dehydrogenase